MCDVLRTRRVVLHKQRFTFVYQLLITFLRLYRLKDRKNKHFVSISLAFLACVNYEFE